MKRNGKRSLYVFILLLMGLLTVSSSYAKGSVLQDTPTADPPKEEADLQIVSANHDKRISPQNRFPSSVNSLNLNETFDSPSIPSGWQVTGSPLWRFDNPQSRTNYTGGEGNIAIADSDYEGTVDMDTSLLTPVLNLSAANSVKLNFKTYFSPYDNSTADVDVSIDGGTTWTNLWQKTGVTHQGTVTLNVTQAIGQSNVRFRFHYYKANWAWYWQIDDVQIETPSAPFAPGSLEALESGNDVNLNWADNSENEANFIIEQSPNGIDNWIEVGRVSANTTTFTHKDVGCGTVTSYRAKAISGSLVSDYSNIANISMSVCPPSIVGLNENFDAAQSLPSGWVISRATWNFNETNTTGGTGNAATGKPVYSSLDTPLFNMVGANAVLLKFKADIKIYAGQSLAQMVFVEISQDGGTTWTIVWERTSAYKGEVNIDLSQWAANRNNLKVRFRNNLPYGGSYFQIDDVEITSMPAPGVPQRVYRHLGWQQ